MDDNTAIWHDPLTGTYTASARIPGGRICDSAPFRTKIEVRAWLLGFNDGHCDRNDYSLLSSLSR
jgi:hypothetical protein